MKFTQTTEKDKKNITTQCKAIKQAAANMKSKKSINI